MEKTLEEIKKEKGIIINQSEIGFLYTDIFQVIELYKLLCIPILGGDVYILRNGKYYTTYDNWFVNRIKNEDLNSYLLRSVQKTRKYIENYMNKEAVCFVLVPN
jgi:hypothetical protein